MAFWDKAVSAAKSAVNKVKETVNKVVSTVKKTVTKAVSTVKTVVKKVSSYVKDKVSSSVKKAKSSVKKVKAIVKNNVINTIDNVKDEVASIQNGIIDKLWIGENEVREKIEDIKDTIKEGMEKAVDKAIQKITDIRWIEKLLTAFRPHLAFLGTPKFDIIKSTYEVVTGKRLTELEWAIIQRDAVDWALGLNTLSKLFTGKNLDGTPGKVETTDDYINLASFALIFIPGTKLGVWAGKLGSKGFIKLFGKIPPSAIKIFAKLNVDDQAKMIRGLLKTDEGVVIINKLLAGKAVKVTLVKPTISLVNKELTKKILFGAGFGGMLTRALKPKTILWGLAGMGSILTLAYGIPFGTSWLAKEGIKEQFEIPLADRMRDYRFDPTVEKLEIIRDDIKKLRTALPIARETIMRVAWLWPPTKEAWEFYAENIYFSIEQYEKELELLLPPELMVLPEKVEAVVRDIIDGDTIDVGLEAKDQETGRDIKLSEYQKTGHARVRILGINAPEKSPKGEILCTGIEIFNVEKEFADKSRDALLPLNDKKVILKIDPENAVDTYNRILAVVELAGEDIGLRQIKEGLACYYFREENKYLDEDLYSEETLDAKEAGTGMWIGLEDIEKEEDKIKIKITSNPTNARLFLDDIALRHNTPSDEIELSDVIHLFTLGKHVLSAEKGGLSAMIDIEIEKGDNGTFNLDLETAPLDIEEVPPDEVPPDEVIPEEVTEPVKISEIPKPFTDEQTWALNEAFAKILALTEGTKIMSEEERGNLINSFDMYTDGQKEILKLLWRDITYYTQGTAQLSADEYIELKEKYGGI